MPAYTRSQYSLGYMRLHLSPRMRSIHTCQNYKQCILQHHWPRMSPLGTEQQHNMLTRHYTKKRKQCVSTHVWTGGISCCPWRVCQVLASAACCALWTTRCWVPSTWTLPTDYPVSSRHNTELNYNPKMSSVMLHCVNKDYSIYTRKQSQCPFWWF